MQQDTLSRGKEIGEEKRTVDSAKFEFFDEITRIMHDREGEGEGGYREACGSRKFLNS